MADPHVHERGIIVETPDAELGSVPAHDVTPRLSATPGSLRNPAPTIGQHNSEIYGRIGYPPERVETLRSTGVI
jgi:crotonobetainyl-CoA:carnitine CoA-transferase CaiB-like acyl-CoA transferase